uniref:Uncharacterized protein n=1 Tax=Knipowitschia caucasica TaxID=637954 RepID=A0AAV2M564_KNICA
MFQWIFKFFRKSSVQYSHFSPPLTRGPRVTPLLPPQRAHSHALTRALTPVGWILRSPPEPPRSAGDPTMEPLMDGGDVDKCEEDDFDPFTGNIPATKVEITVSCR